MRNKKNFHFLVDTVRFGGRLDQPPQFSGKWAKNRSTMGIKSLLLINELKLPEHIDHAQEIENERTRAIKAYRKIKKKTSQTPSTINNDCNKHHVFKFKYYQQEQENAF